MGGLIENNLTIVTSDGLRVAINEIESCGFTPQTNIVDKGYSPKKGFARFDFPYKEDINSSTYDFIEDATNM